MAKVGNGRGFTLLEVIISVLLIMVALGALGITIVSAKRFLKLSENRSQAMSLAVSAMERCLAKSYATVDVDVPVDDISDDGFDWTVTVAPATVSGVSITIPYKKIDVLVSYQEAGENNTQETKNIRISNIIPYPAVHTDSVYLGSNIDEVSASYAEIPGLAIDINYEVTKNIMVTYNVAVNVQDNKTNKLISSDTIYTTCSLDGARQGIVTRTPILTQPSFNNVVVLKDVASGVHEIAVQWKKKVKEADAGEITLKEANLIIVAAESES